MNTAEQIYQETLHLPQAEAREGLDFVAFLKVQGQLRFAEQQGAKTAIARRKAELLECFSQLHVDMSNFTFNREAANAQR